MNFVQGGSVGIMVNDNIGHSFQARKRTRWHVVIPNTFQCSCWYVGNPHCKGIRGWSGSGLTPHLIEGGVSIIQYADDTFLFMEHDFEKALPWNQHCVYFEKILGLKINFHNSEIFFLVKKEMGNNIISKISVVDLVPYLFSILGYLSITKKSVINNGIL